MIEIELLNPVIKDDTPIYDGPVNVVPSTESQTLETAGKKLESDVTIAATPLEAKTLNVSDNGQYSVTPDEAVGLSEVEVNVDVQPELQTKSVEYTANVEQTITADDGYYGLSAVNVKVDIRLTPQIPTDCVLFYSFNPFYMYTNSKGWNGTIYYSNDHSSWDIWNGEKIYPSFDGQFYKIYMRGKDNTHLNTSYNNNGRWRLYGFGITICGEFTKVLDFEVEKTLDSSAFFYLFAINHNLDCKDLTITRDTLSISCCQQMFYQCYGLVNAPKLVVSNYESQSCQDTFYECVSLQNIPFSLQGSAKGSAFSGTFDGCSELKRCPPIRNFTLSNAGSLFSSTFRNCSKLETIPALIITGSLPSQFYQYMFSGCSKIKVSATQSDEYPNAWRIPMEGSCSDGYNSFRSMLYGTGGTYTADPTANTTYYTANEVIY